MGKDLFTALGVPQHNRDFKKVDQFEHQESSSNDTEDESILEDDPDLDVQHSYKERIDNGEFMDLVKRPLAGSAISTFTNRGMQNKKSVDKWMSSKFMPQVGMVLMNDDIPVSLYVLFRLVMPHNLAVEYAEKYNKEFLQPGSCSEFDLISALTGVQVGGRKDMLKVVQKIGTYHPSLTGFFKSLMGNS